MQIVNSKRSAKQLARHIIAKKITPVFDLDGVLIDATHRQNTHPDGTLNLEHYRENSTAEKIARDSELPLLHTIELLNEAGIRYHVCTARVPCKNTKNWLTQRNVKPARIMGRAGESDHRRDHELKGHHFLKSFSTRQRTKMVLIDDNEKNCQTARSCGLSSVHVPFRGH